MWTKCFKKLFLVVIVTITISGVAFAGGALSAIYQTATVYCTTEMNQQGGIGGIQAVNSVEIEGNWVSLTLQSSRGTHLKMTQDDVLNAVQAVNSIEIENGFIDGVCQGAFYNSATMNQVGSIMGRQAINYVKISN